MWWTMRAGVSACQDVMSETVQGSGRGWRGGEGGGGRRVEGSVKVEVELSVEIME